MSGVMSTASHTMVEIDKLRQQIVEEREKADRIYHEQQDENIHLHEVLLKVWIAVTILALTVLVLGLAVVLG